MRASISVLTIIPLLSGCSVFGINTVEEARYELLISEDKYELRLYEPIVIAEAYVEGSFDKAGAQAFRKLFEYISGDNTTRSEIAMTAPVIAKQDGSNKSMKIDMTVPVMEERSNQGWRYMFVLPAGYSINTTPAPVSENIKISTMPQKQVAIVRYSGSWDEKVIDEKSSQLKHWIMANGLTPASEPRWAGYNPPWTLPFLRRNEVMIDAN